MSSEVIRAQTPSSGSSDSDHFAAKHLDFLLGKKGFGTKIAVECTNELVVRRPSGAMDKASPAACVLVAAAASTLVVGSVMAMEIFKMKNVRRRLKKLEKASTAADMAECTGEEEEEEDNEAGDSEAESSDEAEHSSTSKSKKGKKMKGKKEKSKKKSVSEEDWEWPIYDEWTNLMTFQTRRKLRAEAEAPAPNGAPFEVNYMQRRDGPVEVSVTLLSAPLIAAVQQCLPESYELYDEKPKVKGKDLFLALELLRAYKVPGAETCKCHMKHLLRFLETEYKDTIVQVARMRREKTVTWELLWAFLPKKEKVHYRCSVTGQKLQGIVQLAYYFSTTDGKYLGVNLEVRDHNSQAYVKGNVFVTVKEFQGEKMLEAVGVCPMQFVNRRDQLEAIFLANGRKFFTIAEAARRSGGCFMQYKGPHATKVQTPAGCWQLKKRKGDGRVMVDLLSFARMNPDYPLNNAEPPSCDDEIMMSGADCDAEPLSSCDTNLVLGADCDEAQEIPSDEELMLAPAIVFGFSFTIKQWGAFEVSGFSEINFDDQAFDRDLTLSDPTQKDMIQALVSQYVHSPSGDDKAGKMSRIDPIANKGEGCIFLCYGPPGTGKTLTAESVAEKLHRPLWAISVFELGVEASAVETSLMEILDIASQWRAVLLLDEADIYMEKRTSDGDPNRASMTAIFLRLLEYYQGVLFLTTNRVTSFDDAFCSRISMFLRYRSLTVPQREKVWYNFLARAGVKDVDLSLFAGNALNGREIRNIVRIAQTWATSSGEELTTSHVLRVVEMVDGFRKDLQGAINEDEGDQRIFSALAKKKEHGLLQNGHASSGIAD